MLVVVIALALIGSEAGVHTADITIPDFRFGDNVSLLAEESSDLQQLVDRLHGISSRFGFRITDTKTEVRINGKDERELCIKLGVNELKQTKHSSASIALLVLQKCHASEHNKLTVVGCQHPGYCRLFGRVIDDEQMSIFVYCTTGQTRVAPDHLASHHFVAAAV